jgi:branched-chain amino acid transport system ATP-binding protein
MAGAAAALLQVDEITISFGGLVALDGVSFDVREGAIAGLIGPNGAGKTTLFNCITRLYSPDRGRITFAGQDLLRTPAYRIAGAGIARTFQNLALIPGMSVLENVLIGAHCTLRADPVSSALRLPHVRREERQAREQALQVIDYLRLSGVRNLAVGVLPYGLQKRVETARALASRPRLLLLDEPAGGLSHEEVLALAHEIRDIRDRFNLTILLVEHHMSLVMGVSDQVAVLDFGKRIALGTPDEVRKDRAVIEAYLGDDADPATEEPATTGQAEGDNA